MAESERAALEHIRKVVDSILGELPEETAGQNLNTRDVSPRLLNVPYLAQGCAGSRQPSDSGATAGAMLVRAYTQNTPTPEEFYSRTGQESGAALTIQHVVDGLGQFGVEAEPRAGLGLGDLALVLTSGRPMILLIKQDVLREAGLTGETSCLPHFLVVVGVDVERFYIHDPLRQDASGQNQGVPFLVLYRAWSQAALDRLAIIPRRALIRRVRVVAKALNVREAPDGKAKIVDIVHEGNCFEITRQREEWGMIGEDRWVNMKYVRDV